jgi:hypothetical protein
LYATFLDIIRTQTNKDGVPPLLSTEEIVRLELDCQRLIDEPDNDSVPAEELKRLHRDRVECGDYERVSK